MPTKEQQMEKIGRGLAATCNWNRDEILAAAFHALTDANFHEDAAKIMHMTD